MPQGYTDRIRVMMSQVDRTSLDRIRAMFGGTITLRETGVHELVPGDMGSTHRFLTSILAYLPVKKCVAEKGILFCEERLQAHQRFRARRAEIAALRDTDPKKWTYRRLAEHFGVCKQRIAQLLRKKGDAEADCL